MLDNLYETSISKIVKAETSRVVGGLTPQIPKSLYTARGRADKIIVS
jgi:hypothetical protein